MTRQRRKPLTAGKLMATIGLLLAIDVICIAAALHSGAGQTGLFALVNGTEMELRILLEVRAPRVFMAALLGGALAVAGVAFQALLRNPLADPFVLGVSGGASLGGVLAIALGAGSLGLLGAGLVVPVFAFAGALATLMLVQSIATVDGRMSVYTVLLTGVIFNAFSGAIIFFLQSVASLEQLHEIVFYLMGRIPTLPFAQIGVLGALILLAVFALFLRSREFNAMSLGEEGAAYLGVDVERSKRVTFVLGSLLTALSVAAAGMIGFVGLIVPHILRLILGPDHRLLVPVAFFGGAAFLVIADWVSRVAVAPNELPVGVITAAVGGPFFLVLLRRRGTVFGSA